MRGMQMLNTCDFAYFRVKRLYEHAHFFQFSLFLRICITHFMNRISYAAHILLVTFSSTFVRDSSVAFSLNAQDRSA